MTNAYPEARGLADKYIPGGQLVDLSTASISYAPIPAQGRIVDAFATISAAITGANAVVTVKKLTGDAVVATIGTITIVQSGSYIGQTFKMVVTGSEDDCTVKENDTLVFDSDGGSSTTSIANFLGVIREL